MEKGDFCFFASKDGDESGLLRRGRRLTAHAAAVAEPITRPINKPPKIFLCLQMLLFSVVLSRRLNWGAVTVLPGIELAKKVGSPVGSSRSGRDEI